jgi:hypothetical protein
MLRRFALLGALVCSAMALAGCVAVQPQPDGTFKVSLLPPSSPTTITGGTISGGGTEPVSSGTSGENRGGTGTPRNPAYPGKTLKSGPWTVLDEDTQFAKRLEDGSKASGGKRFLIVNVAIRNATVGAALEVKPNQFALWSPKNKVVNPFPTKLGIYNARSVRPIPAAMGGITAFVYEVPVNDDVYTFTMSPKQGATGSLSWWVP